jgi:preprotein translocase subunit SecD
MRLAIAALCVAGALAASPAQAAQKACGESVRLSVDPPSRTDDVAATLRRRLVAAGEKQPSVERDGAAGLRVALPVGASDSILTRPAKIEFRLVAKSADERGAVAMPRLDGKGVEYLEPQIILDEERLRQIRVKLEPNSAGGEPIVAIAFHIETTGVNNLLTATSEAVGRKLAIVVDDRIVADPVIRAPVASLTGEISGGFTPASANELVALIANGRLRGRVSILDRQPAPCMTR